MMKTKVKTSHPNKHQRQLMSWFSSLTVEDRIKATTIDNDPRLVESITRAYAELTKPSPVDWRDGDRPITSDSDFGDRHFMFSWDSDNYEFRASSFPNVKPLSIDWNTNTKCCLAERTLINSVTLSWSLFPGLDAPSSQSSTLQTTTSSSVSQSYSSLVSPPLVSIPATNAELLSLPSRSASAPATPFFHSSFSHSFSSSLTTSASSSLGSSLNGKYLLSASTLSNSNNNNENSDEFQVFLYPKPDILSLHRSFVSNPTNFFNIFWWIDTDRKYHTIGEYIACAIETRLWRNYYELTATAKLASTLSPRTPSPAIVPSEVVDAWVHLEKRERAHFLKCFHKELSQEQSAPSKRAYLTTLKVLTSIYTRKFGSNSCTTDMDSKEVPNKPPSDESSCLENALFCSALTEYGTSEDVVIKMVGRALVRWYKKYIVEGLGAPPSQRKSNSRKAQGKQRSVQSAPRTPVSIQIETKSCPSSPDLERRKKGSSTSSCGFKTPVIVSTSNSLSQSTSDTENDRVEHKRKTSPHSTQSQQTQEFAKGSRNRRRRNDRFSESLDFAVANNMYDEDDDIRRKSGSGGLDFAEKSIQKQQQQQQQQQQKHRSQAHRNMTEALDLARDKKGGQKSKKHTLLAIKVEDSVTPPTSMLPPPPPPPPPPLSSQQQQQSPSISYGGNSSNNTEFSSKYTPRPPLQHYNNYQNYHHNQQQQHFGSDQSTFDSPSLQQRQQGQQTQHTQRKTQFQQQQQQQQQQNKSKKRKKNTQTTAALDLATPESVEKQQVKDTQSSSASLDLATPKHDDVSSDVPTPSTQLKYTRNSGGGGSAKRVQNTADALDLAREKKSKPQYMVNSQYSSSPSSSSYSSSWSGNGYRHNWGSNNSSSGGNSNANGSSNNGYHASHNSDGNGSSTSYHSYSNSGSGANSPSKGFSFQGSSSTFVPSPKTSHRRANQSGMPTHTDAQYQYQQMQQQQQHQQFQHSGNVSVTDNNGSNRTRYQNLRGTPRSYSATRYPSSSSSIPSLQASSTNPSRRTPPSPNLMAPSYSQYHQYSLKQTHHQQQQQQQQQPPLFSPQTQSTAASTSAQSPTTAPTLTSNSHNSRHHQHQQSQSQPPQMVVMSAPTTTTTQSSLTSSCNSNSNSNGNKSVRGFFSPSGLSVALDTPRFNDYHWELSDEIMRYANGLVHTMEQKINLFKSMINRVGEVVSKVLPGAEIYPYGSFMTGLCIPTSDLDLVCCIGGGPDGLQSSFRTLTDVLRAKPWIESIKAIETSKIPVIKIVSKAEHISTDISFASYSYNWPLYHYGLQSVGLVNAFLMESPKLRPLTLILKEFLYEKGLNMPFNGGLSSYCLTIMIKTFLSIFDRSGSRSIGDVLIDFFKYYGSDFDYTTTGISAMRGGVHYRLGSPGHCSGFGAAFVIEDPFNPSSNISAGTFCISQIKAAFAEAHNLLSLSLQQQQQHHQQHPPTTLAVSESPVSPPKGDIPSVSTLVSSPLASPSNFPQNQPFQHLLLSQGTGQSSRDGNGTIKYKLLSRILTKYLN